MTEAMTAPAAMPSEEDVARVIRDEYGCAPACDYPVCIGGECGHECERDDRSVGAFHDAARAVLALFAPILADARDHDRAEIALAEEWERNLQLEARALAAEAALAAEREKAHYANGVAELAMKHRDEAEREALRDELTRLEAAAPLSARETARYLQVERRLLELDAAAIRAEGE